MNSQTTSHTTDTATKQEWIEFTVTGPVDFVRYRTSPDARVVQFWSEHRVPGLARQGWNTTRSETVAMRARKALRDLSASH